MIWRVSYLDKRQIMKIIFILLSIFQAISYGHGEVGVSHSIMGLDHIIAMLGVGIWAHQLLKPSIWILPLVFLIAMASGSILGIGATPLYSVEIVIAFSGVFLGMFIAMDEKFPLWISIPVIFIFALFHGYAHGVELPANSDALLYIIGFSIMALFLMLLGIYISKILKKPFYKIIGTRIIGILIIVIAGIVLVNILLT